MIAILFLPALFLLGSCQKDEPNDIVGPDDQLTISGLRALTALYEATVSFETNLPARAMIEYDTDDADLGLAVYDTLQYVKLHQVFIGGLNPDTQYYFRIRAWSMDSLEAQTEVEYFRTPNPDDVPEGPVITEFTVTDITSNGARATWKTSIVADSHVYWGLSTEVLTDSAANGALITDHAMVITGLQPETAYNVRVASQDTAGNRRYSQIESFNTLEEQGGTVELHDVRVLYTTSSTAAIYWLTNIAADSRILYGERRDFLPWIQIDPEQVLRHIVKLDSLTALTTYHFRASSQTAVETMLSDTLQFTTTGQLRLYAPDTTALNGITFSYPIYVENASELHGLSIIIDYNEAFLEFSNAVPGAFTRDNDHMFFETNNDLVSGLLGIDITWNVIFDASDTNLPIGTHADGGGQVAIIHFQTRFPGEAAVDISTTRCSAYDVFVQRIDLTCDGGVITIQSGE
jgi:hypothetical protein